MSRQQPKTFVFEGQLRFGYLLHLPESYAANSTDAYPLILFLHGRGERGNDIEKIKVHGIPKVIEEREGFPFIAVSPQCPAESWWTMELDALDALLGEILAQYRVDVTRIYLTGLSMGGQGTWHLAMLRPDRFAAIAPVCGFGEPDRVNTIKHIPAWVFHGTKDEHVPLEASQVMVDALKAAGANVRFTIYPDAGHDSWTETYDNPELYQWFLSHHR